LAEYKWTPREYKTRFENATKHPDETYILFAARLRNLLTYYLSSRDVADYNTLFELLISDRLKGALPQGPLNYVLTQEDEGWYTSEVASLADVSVNNRATIAGQKVADGKTARVATTVATEGPRANQGHQGARGGHFSQWHGGTSGTRSPTKAGQVPSWREGFAGTRSPTKGGGIKCYACGGVGHMARDCVSRRSNGRAGFRGVPRRGYRGLYYGNHQSQGGGAHINLCSAVESSSGKDTRDMGVQSDDEGQVMMVTPDEWEFSDFPVVCAVDTVSLNPVCPLFTYIRCVM